MLANLLFRFGLQVLYFSVFICYVKLQPSYLILKFYHKKSLGKQEKEKRRIRLYSIIWKKLQFNPLKFNFFFFFLVMVIINSLLMELKSTFLTKIKILSSLTNNNVK